MVALPNLIFLHWIQYVLGAVGEGKDNTLSLLLFRKSNSTKHNCLILFSIKYKRLNSVVIKMAAPWHNPAVFFEWLDSGSSLITHNQANVHKITNTHKDVDTHVATNSY